MRTEIEKKKDNRALYLAGERKEGKKTIFGDDPTTIHRHAHASHHVEEDTMTHLKRQQKVRFGH
jgi:hypothetical protein